MQDLYMSMPHSMYDSIQMVQMVCLQFKCDTYWALLRIETFEFENHQHLNIQHY